ncbi:hypothetical protein GBAR_LOCUS19123, partial [Geodia barretti]
MDHDQSRTSSRMPCRPDGSRGIYFTDRGKFAVTHVAVYRMWFLMFY